MPIFSRFTQSFSRFITDINGEKNISLLMIFFMVSFSRFAPSRVYRPHERNEVYQGPCFTTTANLLPEENILSLHFVSTSGSFVGCTPQGAYSPRGRSRHLLETPFSEPLLTTLLRTPFYCKAHSRPPSQNPSGTLPQNPFQNLFRTLLRALCCRTTP